MQKTRSARRSSRRPTSRASRDTLLSRFLRYVRVDTQSKEGQPTIPSTPNQWELLRMLEAELRELGASDVHLTESGYVLATIPATTRRRGAPTVGLLAHVDTAPAFPGKNVRPIVHRKWNGRPILLPDDPGQVLDPAEIPELAPKKGEDIVTASGRTLLGADDKAGVAIIMTLVAELLRRPEIAHGPIRVCFNPDEEVGRGVEGLDLDEFGADVAYTLDGENLGEVSWETFSADSATVTIEGVSTHPGEGKKYKMVNALMLAAKLLTALPTNEMNPETTEKRQGFIHPYELDGSTARAEIRFILRDFDLAGLADKRRRLQALCRGLAATEPRAKIACRFREQYRNMGYWLAKDMKPVDLALEAIRACGLTPTLRPVRGGTDGSRLTARGLPTPNIFTGAHNLHGPLEWVSVQDMEKAVQVLIKLVQLWEKR